MRSWGEGREWREWLDGRHREALHGMTRRQRLARWWWINGPAVAVTAALTAVVVGLVAWMAMAR